MNNKKPLKGYHLEVMLYDLPVPPAGLRLGEKMVHAFKFLANKIYYQTYSPGRCRTRVDDYMSTERREGAIRKLRNVVDLHYRPNVTEEGFLCHTIGSCWRQYLD